MENINNMIEAIINQKSGYNLKIDGYLCPGGLSKKVSRIFMTAVRDMEKNHTYVGIEDGFIYQQLFREIYNL